MYFTANLTSSSFFNILLLEEIVPSAADINLVRRKGKAQKVFLHVLCNILNHPYKLFVSNRGISASSGER